MQQRAHSPLIANPCARCSCRAQTQLTMAMEEAFGV
jgi:hypothetical protein